MPDRLAEPLARLAEHARVELREAPAKRGTSVTAVPNEPDVDVRRELREAKQLLETGEVLRVHSWPADRGPAAQKTTDLIDRLLSRGGGR